MSEQKSFIIAKEGKYVIAVLGALLLLVWIFSDGAIDKLVVLGLLLGALYIFREPNRTLSYYEPASIMAPCDGVVTSIEPFMCNGMLQGACIKITVKTRLLDVGVLRAPLSGALDVVGLTRGMQLGSYAPKAAVLNEHAKVMFTVESDPNQKVVIKHKLDRFNVPLAFNYRKKTTLQAGERYGFMAHGQTEIFIPANARLDIKRGTEIKAAQTLLGYFS